MFAAEIRKRRIAHMGALSSGVGIWLRRCEGRKRQSSAISGAPFDQAGEVLVADSLRSGTGLAALKFLKRIMKKYGRPQSIVTGRASPYSAAMNEIGAADRHAIVTGRLNRSGGEFGISRFDDASGRCIGSKYEDAAEI